MYGTDGRLLSGIPISDIGSIHRDDVANMEAGLTDPNKVTIEFGKYKGTKVADIPLGYRTWMIKNFNWNSSNMRLKTAILQTISK